MRKLFQSVRWTMLLWYALILLGLIAGLGLLAYRLAADDRTSQIDRDIRGFQGAFFRSLFASRPLPKKDDPPSMDEIRERLRNPGDVSSFPPELHALFANGGGGSYLAFWDNDDTPLFISANAPDDIKPPQQAPDGPTRYVERGNYREHHRRSSNGMSSIIGRDISAEQGELLRFGVWIALGGGALWLVGLSGGWWLAGRALKPIDDIGRTASRIAAGNLDERIEIANTDNELGRLGQVLNNTFDRLSDAIERQKRFTADASHELRTPVTIILSETQRALKREREPEQYREILGSCRTAAERMRALVESLLVLAKQDLPSPDGARVSCDLAEIAAGVADLLQPLADEHATKIERELAPAPVQGDPHSLAMVVQNLISNALVHPPEGGTVRIRTASGATEAVLEVSDSGPGISAEHLPHLFDRFYRADSSRGQVNGHAGLGLAIARSVVESHGGSIEVRSSGVGSVFQVTLPSNSA
ncbi:ATP-binding protein [Luteolibacter sp. Populi]|uniref:ATP-binding protein n=1 Tax=Luteolibacter sp. Populi TaxID=3230487 RepID=UPI003466BED6